MSWKWLHFNNALQSIQNFISVPASSLTRDMLHPHRPVPLIKIKGLGFNKKKASIFYLSLSDIFVGEKNNTLHPNQARIL